MLGLLSARDFFLVRLPFSSRTVARLFFENFNSTLSDFTEIPVMWCFAFPMAIRNGGGGTTGMDLSPFCLLY